MAPIPALLIAAVGGALAAAGLREAGYAVPAVAQAFLSGCFGRYNCFSSTCSEQAVRVTERRREAQRGSERHLDLLPRLVQQLQCTALFQLCGCHALLGIRKITLKLVDFERAFC